MSRKDDLEQSIRESYDLIRENERIIRTTVRPEEEARARAMIEKQRWLIEEYQTELDALSNKVMPDRTVQTEPMASEPEREISAGKRRGGQAAAAQAGSPTLPPSIPGAATEPDVTEARLATQPRPFWMWGIGVVLALVVLAGGSFLGIRAAFQRRAMSTETPQPTSTVTLTPTPLPGACAGLAACKDSSWEPSSDCGILWTNCLNWAESKRQAGMAEEAVAAYEGILAIRYHPDALWRRGMTYNSLHVWDLAVQDFLEAIRLDPEHNAAHHDLGVSYTNRNGEGDQDRAIEILTRAMEIQVQMSGQPGWHTVLRRGMAYRLRGDYEGDIADYDRCIQDCTYAINKAPTYGASFFNREMCYFAKQEYEEALADCNRLIELNFQNAAVYYERGRVYKAQGERDKAIADFEEVLEISQDSNLRTWAERQLQALGVQ